MADYSPQIATARRLIAAKGMAMDYLRVTEEPGGLIDPDTGKRPYTIERTAIVGVRTAPTAEEVQRGLFQGVNMVVLVAGDAIEAADTTVLLQFDGHDWNIKEIQRVAPAEQIILYKFGVTDAGLSTDETRP